MKSLQKHRAAAASSRGFRLWRRSALGGVALAALFTSTAVYGQGNYYPVDPPGAPYGSTYSGITTHSNSDLQWLQTWVQNLYGPTVTLQVPIPTGSTAPTTAQYSAAISAALSPVIAGLAPAGVTLSGFSNEAVGWRPSDRAATATAIAQAILQYSADPATAVSNLTVAVDGLAKGQPTLIDTIVPSIFSVVAASPSMPAATIPSSIVQLMATAAGDVSADQSRVASILASGLGSISGSTLSAAQKTAAFTDPATGVVNTFLSSAYADNNPLMIDNIVKTVVGGGYSSMASLTQVLNAAVAALPTKNNATLGAVVVGALRTQGGSAATISSVVGAANPGTATYTNAVVNGYSNSSTLAVFQNYVTANPTVADALASGAIVKGSLTAPVVVQWSLRNGTADPKSVVAAAIGAAPSSASATALGAINTTTHTPWGTATFGDLAYGAATASPVEQVGNVIQTILANSSTGITALNTATVTSVVDNAIQGANAGNRANTFTDIVYKAEVIARNTSGASALLVKQGVDSITTAGGPSYLAVVAALAGDAFGSNRAVIQSAGFSELASMGGDVTAAQGAANLITLLQTNSTKSYGTLAAFSSAATTSTNSVIANLYAAILANPTEADAGLAAALKQSNVSAGTLLSLASDALRSSNTTFYGVNPTLQMVRDVVTHIKASELAGVTNDMVDFVSHQIVLNPSMLKDIVIAATVINPDNVNFVAHAAAFNKPLQVNTVVNSLFNYSQLTATTVYAAPSALNPSGLLTTKSFPGTRGVVIDQPGVAAAITSALTTGILESNMSASDTQSALVSTVTAAVASSITQNGTNLRGPTNPFNGADSAAHFRQSDGASPTSIKTGTQLTVGVAGAITGYIAEVTNSGDSTISAITKAVLTAAVGGGARSYALEIAQAAAQALRWVGGANVSAAASPTSQVAGNPAYDIALAMSTSVVNFATLPQLMNAAYFGITEAAAGTIGAGALGLNATGLNPGTGALIIKASGNANSDFYQHRSATGTPVTNIFNL